MTRDQKAGWVLMALVIATVLVVAKGIFDEASANRFTATSYLMVRAYSLEHSGKLKFVRVSVGDIVTESHGANYRLIPGSAAMQTAFDDYLKGDGDSRDDGFWYSCRAIGGESLEVIDLNSNKKETVRIEAFSVPPKDPVPMYR